MSMKFLVKVQGKNKFFSSLFDARQYAEGFKYSRVQVSKWSQGTWLPV